MEISRILVTGATGFIGRYLFAQLTGRGYAVTGLSKHGGTAAGRPIAAVDITDESAVNEFFGKHRIDMVFHLACYIPREGDENSFERCWRVNGAGTRNLVRAAAAQGVKRFIYTSSQTVCTGAGRTYVSEDVESPSSEYGVTKLAGEHLSRIYSADFMRLVILRYGSVYGSGQVPATALTKFVEKSAQKEPLTIWGDGGSTYDYIYVKDAVELTMKAGLSDEVGVFNVGSGEPTSIKVLAETLAGLCPGVKIFFDESKPDAGRRFCFDMEKTRKTFGCAPRYSLRDGLKEYLGERAQTTCLNQ